MPQSSNRPHRGEGWSKIDEAPFDFERRSISVLVERGATAS